MGQAQGGGWLVRGSYKCAARNTPSLRFSSHNARPAVRGIRVFASSQHTSLTTRDLASVSGPISKAMTAEPFVTVAPARPSPGGRPFCSMTMVQEARSAGGSFFLHPYFTEVLTWVQFLALLVTVAAAGHVVWRTHNERQRDRKLQSNKGPGH